MKSLLLIAAFVALAVASPTNRGIAGPAIVETHPISIEPTVIEGKPTAVSPVQVVQDAVNIPRASVVQIVVNINGLTHAIDVPITAGPAADAIVAEDVNVVEAVPKPVQVVEVAPEPVQVVEVAPEPVQVVEIAPAPIGTPEIPVGIPETISIGTIQLPIPVVELPELN